MTPYPEYRWVELAWGGPHNRGHIVPVDEVRKRLPRGRPDCYRTMWRYPDAFMEYYKAHRNEKGQNTVRGYRGPVFADAFWVDIDSDDLRESHQMAKTALHILQAKFDVDLGYVWCFFSGSKGFHLLLPAPLFGAIEPGNDLPATFKAMAERMWDGRIPTDGAVYDHVRLFRLSNTVNSKSGLYKIALTPAELLHLSIDEIKALARRPRNAADVVHEAPESANPALAELYTACRSQAGKKAQGLTKEQLLAMLQGPVTPGNRHPSMTSLAGHLIARGVDPDVVLELLLCWNEARCVPPKPREEVEAVVRDIFAAEFRNAPERAEKHALRRVMKASGLPPALAREVLQANHRG